MRSAAGARLPLSGSRAAADEPEATAEAEVAVLRFAPASEPGAFQNLMEQAAVPSSSAEAAVVASATAAVEAAVA